MLFSLSASVDKSRQFIQLQSTLTTQSNQLNECQSTVRRQQHIQNKLESQVHGQQNEINILKTRLNKVRLSVECHVWEHSPVERELVKSCICICYFPTDGNIERWNDQCAVLFAYRHVVCWMLCVWWYQVLSGIHSMDAELQVFSLNQLAHSTTTEASPPPPEPIVSIAQVRQALEQIRMEGMK